MKFLIILAFVTLVIADDYLSQLRSSTNQFSANLLQEALNGNPGRSTVVSGFSVMSPLAQLLLGSVGGTHYELLRLVGLPNDQAVVSTFGAVNGALNALRGSGVELRVANRLYVGENQRLNQTFQQLSSDAFGSGVQRLNFNNWYLSADVINKFVEEATNHRIKDLVSAGDFANPPSLVLVNAVYFLGTWLNQFPPENTRPQVFHLSSSNTVQLPMMSQSAYFRYTHSDALQAQILELPYKGGNAAFIVVLPDEVDGLAGVQNKIRQNPALLQLAMSMLYRTYVNVQLPKFKVETTTDLKPLLENLGLRRLFHRPELSYIVENGDLLVSSAKQKAFLEVNELGVEAAAATVSQMASAAFIPVVAKFKVDRPFYFTLKVEDFTLFSGAYYG